ncbi:MAG: hypothetical protein ACJ78Q_09545 [Chloroflexia bacterium]
MATTQTQTSQIPPFLAGDVILFAGEGDLYSEVGGWLMRDKGEGPTYAVHTAHFLDGRRVLEMDFVGRIKSLDDVLNRRYKLDMWKRRGFEVWRCATLTPDQRRALTRESMRYLNAKFGMAKFLAHLLDDLIGKAAGREFFFFRHIDPQDRRPVCSGITASVYDRALSYRFGVDPECADPDDIYDWVTSHPGEWARVFRLEQYSVNPTQKTTKWAAMLNFCSELVRATRA